MKLAKGIYRGRRKGKHKYRRKHHQHRHHIKRQLIAKEPTVGPSRRHGNGRTGAWGGDGLADDETVDDTEEEEEDIPMECALSIISRVTMRARVISKSKPSSSGD